MMKGMRITQQQYELAMVEENMSNLTSAASGEASVSSNNPVQNKKKRNLPGNPDPEAEVVALSPESLMACNRFVCEICRKGFQREQNLQLHRRGHNLPWKLKQKKETVRKKVYVCPEASCVHHDPSRALGDLTGIKKHFSRKHGEKKWKCDKCSKKYAVQSDWKAHSKICGTREYKCDCGTLFSRKDSFITHRAFCDALSKETASVNHHQYPLQFPHDASSSLLQQPNLLQSQRLPPWQGSCSSGLTQLDQLTNAAMIYHPPAKYNTSPHMSATALLQKASEMGASMSRPSNLTQMPLPRSTNVISSSAEFVGHGGHVENMLLSSLASTTTPESMDGSCFRDAFEGMEGMASHEVTRDFLGLQGLPQRSIFKLHGLEQQHQQTLKRLIDCGEDGMSASMATTNCAAAEEADDCRDDDVALRLKVAAFAAILVAGALGVAIPLVGRRVRTDGGVFVFAKAFAAGVILATGFVHMLHAAESSFSNPCLRRSPWQAFPFSGFVAMVAALGTLVVDFVSTQYYQRKHQAEAPPSPSGIAVDPAAVDERSTSTASEDDPMHIVRVHAHAAKHRHSHANAHFDALPTRHHGHGHGHDHDHEEEDNQGGLSHVRQVVVSQILEMGIVSHSVIIGLSLGVSQNPCAIRPLVAALSFHQFFEGFALGGCISEAQFKKTAAAVMAGFFAATTPLGIAVGAGVASSSYDASSLAALVVEGLLDSMSAGILIYMALVDLIAADFLSQTARHSVRYQVASYLALFVGAAAMSALAIWA